MVTFYLFLKPKSAILDFLPLTKETASATIKIYKVLVVTVG